MTQETPKYPQIDELASHDVAHLRNWHSKHVGTIGEGLTLVDEWGRTEKIFSRLSLQKTKSFHQFAMEAVNHKNSFGWWFGTSILFSHILGISNHPN